ncbi:centrosomal protein of 78 kDa-like isoform X2 [Lycorma delicatula]|uniref:centrosomal protein of 78 kDa-like isoform X2 n=1 Tax=Lycorma delicatula TaxID=130591 RepID=UPI003F513C5E
MIKNRRNSNDYDIRRDFNEERLEKKSPNFEKRSNQTKMVSNLKFNAENNSLKSYSNRSSKQSCSSGYYSMLPSARERIENQHNFSKHYKYLCEVNNTVPKVRVQQDQVLEFYGDRIRMEDWLPIIKAIENDHSLKIIKIYNRNLSHPGFTKDPALYKRKILNSLITAIQQCLLNSKVLTDLYLEAIPFSIANLKVLFGGLEKSKNIQHIAFPHCSLGNKGCELLCRILRYLSNIKSVDISACGITAEGALHISQVIQVQKLSRYGDCWKESLRYRHPNPASSNGLYRIKLDNNINLTDTGFSIIVNALFDDLWITEILCKNCGLTNESAELAFTLAKNNYFIKFIDIRKNLGIDPDLIRELEKLLITNSSFPVQKTWNSEVEISEQNYNIDCNRKYHRDTSKVYSSNDQCSSKESVTTIKDSASSCSEMHVPPLQISHTRRNFKPQKNISASQQKLSELRKLKKDLNETKNKLYNEISKRKAIEKYCEHLEMQLRENSNYVLLEKDVLAKLIQTFESFTSSLNDITKLDSDQKLARSKGSLIAKSVQKHTGWVKEKIH